MMLVIEIITLSGPGSKLKFAKICRNAKKTNCRGLYSFQSFQTGNKDR